MEKRHIEGPKGALFSCFWLLRGHFSTYFGAQREVYDVLGHISVFQKPGGHLSI